LHRKRSRFSLSRAIGVNVGVLAYKLDGISGLPSYPQILNRDAIELGEKAGVKLLR
jgi:hypothetical protein